MTLHEMNLVAALKMGKLTWFEFFEAFRTATEARSSQSTMVLTEPKKTP